MSFSISLQKIKVKKWIKNIGSRASVWSKNKGSGPPTSRRMPIVLGTFTSSSTKFVDLSYYAQSCRDSMKALQPLVAKNARRSSSICCRWRPNNERSTLLFSLFSSFVSQNPEYAHISQRTFKSWESLCVILPEFCSKIKPQKERWNFPFILVRARSRLCRK